MRDGGRTAIVMNITRSMKLRRRTRRFLILCRQIPSSQTTISLMAMTRPRYRPG